LVLLTLKSIIIELNMEEKIKLSDPIITLLLFLSVVFFAFLTIQSQEIVYPPDPRIAFNQELVHMYLTATDWKTIHLIEEKIDLGLLDSDTKLAIFDKNWENYKKDPLEYQGEHGKKLWEHSSKTQVTQLQIITDRESYLLQSTSSQPSSELILSDLHNINEISSGLISQLTNKTDNSSNYPDSPLENKYTALHAAIKKFEQTSKYPVPTYIAYYFPSYKQKYQAIVYESYDDLPIDADYFGKPLSEISFEILTNQREDLYLQTIALDKLSQVDERNKQIKELRPRLIQTLYKMLKTGENTGVYLSQDYTDDEQIEFRILLLNRLSQEVNEEQNYLFRKAQEINK
jgi:hypothetical protein